MALALVSVLALVQVSALALTSVLACILGPDLALVMPLAFAITLAPRPDLGALVFGFGPGPVLARLCPGPGFGRFLC